MAGQRRELFCILCSSLILGAFANNLENVLGVDYYPEQWPSDVWEEDARNMSEIGIRVVRIGEFIWSTIEPERGVFNWTVLDDILEIFDRNGLKVIMGTPTATPPKWLIDEHPDILPIGFDGHVRKFGSRKHYSFSSPIYMFESARITTAFAKRFGRHPAVIGWQTDNEYGNGDTTKSYGPFARLGFDKFLEEKYQTIENLNREWGTSFWSMGYNNFSQINLPNRQVESPDPSHVLDFDRYSSGMVKLFNRVQVEIIKALSPGRFVTTNFMGFFFDFDHWLLAEDLDMATWDMYPLGSTDTSSNIFEPEEMIRYSNTGHPDMPAFNHDLYRAIGRGRFGIMEQQAGPVNWATHNPAPVDGIVRVWALQEIAHGAELVAYFRWRQALFAQEQGHSGLNRPDFVHDKGYFIVKRIFEDLKRLSSAIDNEDLPLPTSSGVAVMVDYESKWIFDIDPLTVEWSFLKLVFMFYSELKKLGLNVDFVRPGAELSSYRVVVVPSFPFISNEAAKSFRNYEGQLIFGPRSGGKTENYQWESNLGPGKIEDILPIKIIRASSTRPDISEPVVFNRQEFNATIWREYIEILDQDSDIQIAKEAIFRDARPFENSAVVRTTNSDGRRKTIHYIAFWPQRDFISEFLQVVLAESNIPFAELPEDLRIQKRGPFTFAFNFSPNPIFVPFSVAPRDAEFVIGKRVITPHDVSVFTVG